MKRSLVNEIIVQLLGFAIIGILLLLFGVPDHSMTYLGVALFGFLAGATWIKFDFYRQQQQEQLDLGRLRGPISVQDAHTIE